MSERKEIDDFEVDEFLKRFVKERMQGFEPRSTEELWQRFEETRLRKRRGVRDVVKSEP